MKKIYLLIMMLFALNTVDAQFKYGLRAGGATSGISSAKDQIITQGTDSLRMTLGSTHFGFHVGGFARITFGEKFFFQPEILFNTKGVDYTIYDISGLNPKVLKDEFMSVDLPLIVGYSFSSLRLQAGAIGSMTIVNNNQLIEHFQTQKDLVTTLQGFNWGWQVGLGLDISNFMIDLKYEGSFLPVGNGITIDGNEYDFDGRINRFVVSFGYSF